MQTNLTTVPASRQYPITPEIAEALKTARAAEFRLEAEYFSLDWESRLELADELRAMCDDLDDRLTDVAARVADDLEDESEDFSSWETRSDASRRVRQIVRALEACAPTGPPPLPCNCGGRCAGETFDCATCGHATPICRGAADDRPDDCDACWDAAEKGGAF